MLLDCWSIEPDNRPTINQVVAKLKAIIKDFQPFNYNQSSNQQQLDSNIVEVSENNSLLHLSQLIQNFNKMNTREINQNINNLSENNVSIIVNEIIDIINTLYITKQNILSCLNNHNVDLKEICSWLLNNQNDSSSIVIFGFFNFYGIGTNINNRKAFELFEKAANLGYPLGISQLGNCYRHGIGTSIDNQKAFELFQKAADLDQPSAIYNLGYCYQLGIGISID